VTSLWAVPGGASMTRFRCVWSFRCGGREVQQPAFVLNRRAQLEEDSWWLPVSHSPELVGRGDEATASEREARAFQRRWVAWVASETLHRQCAVQSGCSGDALGSASCDCRDLTIPKLRIEGEQPLARSLPTGFPRHLSLGPLGTPARARRENQCHDQPQESAVSLSWVFWDSA
jgi:hypothetical protein